MPKSKSTTWKGPVEAFRATYQQIQKNPQPALVFVGLYTAASIISLIIQGKSSYSEKDYISYADILMLYFIYPVTVYSLALADKKFMSVNDFLQINLKKWVFLIGTSLLSALIFIGSALLLVIPLIWTLAWFAMALYVVVDKDMTPIEALKESKRLSENQKKKVWQLIGVSILVSIAAAIVAVVPYIGIAAVSFASLLTTATAARLYRWLQTQ